VGEPVVAIGTSGKVIGVNPQIISQTRGSQGLGFAVPIAIVAHAYLGDSGQTPSALIARHKPGDTITLTVLSGGQTRQVKATLSARSTGA